jgi:hypothetical protein
MVGVMEAVVALHDLASIYVSLIALEKRGAVKFFLTSDGWSQ